MASRATTVEFIAEQVSGAGVIAMRKMFGEYAIYCDIKLTALVCDDRLVVKPTKAGRTHIGEVAEQPPYHGAKAYYLISGDMGRSRLAYDADPHLRGRTAVARQVATGVSGKVR